MVCQRKGVLFGCSEGVGLGLTVDASRDRATTTTPATAAAGTLSDTTAATAGGGGVMSLSSST